MIFGNEDWRPWVKGGLLAVFRALSLRVYMREQLERLERSVERLEKKVERVESKIDSSPCHQGEGA